MGRGYLQWRFCASQGLVCGPIVTSPAVRLGMTWAGNVLRQTNSTGSQWFTGKVQSWLVWLQAVSKVLGGCTRACKLGSLLTKGWALQDHPLELPACTAGLFQAPLVRNPSSRPSSGSCSGFSTVVYFPYNGPLHSSQFRLLPHRRS